ncbi:MAG: hypothetical protein ACE363_12365 [Alphaproteobacteria bacterium]
MDLTRTIDPAVEPLSTAEVKDHLRLDGVEEDAPLGALVTSARQACETYTRRSMITQTWRLRLDSWPGKHMGDAWWDGTREGSLDAVFERARTLALPRGPMQSITSVTVTDADANQMVIASNGYTASTGLNGRLALRSGQAWPSATAPVDAIEIIYVTGFGDSWNDVPASLRHGMMVLVAHLYEHREVFPEGGEGGLAALPAPVVGLWRPWRQVSL